ncbi:MAG: ribulose-phosphate 3-epimerase [Armatimonadota bacterium]
MDQIIVSPSLLCADFANLQDDVQKLEAAGADWLQFDCMDGHFTEQVTHGHIIVQALRDVTDLFFDCHLMFDNPEKHVEFFAEAGADGISIHHEATKEPEVLLDRIRDLGCKSNLVINPATPVEAVRPLLPHCDIVMVMGVVPGYAGQAFIPETTGRISQLKEIISDEGFDIPIEVDGGVNADTAPGLVAAGAEILVSGSFISEHPDGYGAAIGFLHALGN